MSDKDDQDSEQSTAADQAKPWWMTDAEPHGSETVTNGQDLDDGPPDKPAGEGSTVPVGEDSPEPAAPGNAILGAVSDALSDGEGEKSTQVVEIKPGAVPQVDGVQRFTVESSESAARNSTENGPDTPGSGSPEANPTESPVDHPAGNPVEPHTEGETPPPLPGIEPDPTETGEGGQRAAEKGGAGRAFGSRNVKYCTQTKRDGSPCKQPACKGSEKCRMHGGTAVYSSNVKLPAKMFLLGRYRDRLPVRMLETYERALNDPDLTSLRDEIAVIEIRIGELIGRLRETDGAAPWDQLKKYSKILNTAIYRKSGDSYNPDIERIMLADKEIRAAITAGVADEETWNEFRSIVRDKATLSKAESERLQAMGQIITAERAFALIMSIARSVQRHVMDQGTRNRIVGDIMALLQHGKPIDPESGDQARVDPAEAPAA